MTSSKLARFAQALIFLSISASARSEPQASSSLGEYWASCAAATMQRALIQEELEKKSADELLSATGHYYRISCSYSSLAETNAAFSKARDAQMDSFVAAAKACSPGNPTCIASFVDKLEGQLLVCAGTQKQQGDDIATALQAANKRCDFKVNFVP